MRFFVSCLLPPYSLVHCVLTFFSIYSGKALHDSFELTTLVCGASASRSYIRYIGFHHVSSVQYLDKVLRARRMRWDWLRLSLQHLHRDLSCFMYFIPLTD